MAGVRRSSKGGYPLLVPLSLNLKTESKLLDRSLLSVIEVKPHDHQPNILEYLQKNSPQIQQKSLTSVGKTPLV